MLYPPLSCRLGVRRQVAVRLGRALGGMSAGKRDGNLLRNTVRGVPGGVILHMRVKRRPARMRMAEISVCKRQSFPFLCGRIQ